MSTKHKKRNPGDWVAIQRGRQNRQGRPAVNHPAADSGGLTMSKGPGSTRYQRMLVSLQRKSGRH